MIKPVIVCAAGHQREASHLSEDSPIAILPIEARASCVLAKGDEPSDSDQWPQVPCPILPDSARCHDCRTCRATDNCARCRTRCPRCDNFPPLASPLARSTHVIEPTKRWRQVIALG